MTVYTSVDTNNSGVNVPLKDNDFRSHFTKWLNVKALFLLSIKIKYNKNPE